MQAMEPSRQTRSSQGPAYPFGRWSSTTVNVLVSLVSFGPALFFLLSPVPGVHHRLLLVLQHPYYDSGRVHCGEHHRGVHLFSRKNQGER